PWPRAAALLGATLVACAPAPSSGSSSSSTGGSGTTGRRAGSSGAAGDSSSSGGSSGGRGAGSSGTAGGSGTTGRGTAGSSTGSSGRGSTSGTSSGGTTTGGGLTPPPPAAAAGFHTLVFDQGGDAGWNVDYGHTGAPGYAWYESGGFYGASGAVATASGGVLTIASASLASATRVLTDDDAGYVGHAFGDGFYVEADIALDGGCVAGGSAPFSAFWGLPVEKELVLGVSDDWPGQAPGYEHYAELDFMEYWGSYTSYYVLDWWGIWQKTCASFCDCGNNGGCKGVPDNGPDDVPAGTSFADFNVYGALVVPSQANDGGSGYTQGYFNGAPTPSHNAWDAYRPALGPPPAGNQIFAVTDVDHYYLIANTTAGCPMRLAYVRVWQAP
ncbi:MAG TPA: hypothetical protein VMB50_16680, partial [Myxococcales bacterium]|nr:hypothetical protein [Myxococcales bacterium]